MQVRRGAPGVEGTRVTEAPRPAVSGTPEAARADAGGRPARAPAPDGRPSVEGRRVLLAEDDPVVRSFVRLSLEQEGLRVLEARDGREALELARAERPDLVLTDLWMPVMNGVELIEALNAQGCSAPVMVLSGHLTASSTDRLRGLGVFKVLPKPVGVEALREAVREGLLDGPQARPARGGAGGAADSSARKVAVLVADDDEHVRGLLRDCLTRQGYQVEEASDGEEAVEKALANDLSLVLMDLNMPRMSGEEAVAALRRASRDCFIICMTGESDQREMDRAVAKGALRCIRKPFDLQELLAELARLDLIAAHRRLLAARERERAARPAERARNWLAVQERRYGRRFKWMLALAALAVAALAAAVPVAALWLERASAAAASAASKIEQAADAAARIEGYLQRDEERELRPAARP